jgi:hypothetical protein
MPRKMLMHFFAVLCVYRDFYGKVHSVFRKRRVEVNTQSALRLFKKSTAGKSGFTNLPAKPFSATPFLQIRTMSFKYSRCFLLCQIIHHC